MSLFFYLFAIPSSLCSPCRVDQNKKKMVCTSWFRSLIFLLFLQRGTTTLKILATSQIDSPAECTKPMIYLTVVSFFLKEIFPFKMMGDKNAPTFFFYCCVVGYLVIHHLHVEGNYFILILFYITINSAIEK